MHMDSRGDAHLSSEASRQATSPTASTKSVSHRFYGQTGCTWSRMSAQPFSQISLTPAVAKAFQIGLYDPAEADLKHFCYTWSVRLVERTAEGRKRVVSLCARSMILFIVHEQTI